jgi:uncharacterized protein (DUF58 family)
MLPSRRLTLLLALGACFFFAAAYLAGLRWAGLLFDGVVVTLCVCDLLMLRAAERVAAHREVEETLSLGAPEPVHLAVTNRSAQWLTIDLRDEPPLSMAAERHSFRFSLGPGHGWRGEYAVTPRERGDHQFGSLYLRVRTPLGLLLRTLTLPVSAPVRVYPDVRQIRQYEMLARQNRTSQVGLRRVRQIGAGTEFERLRDYVPNDELRRVDWKATARRGALMTREYDVERTQTVVLALDLGRTMASRLELMTKADYAVNACVLLSYVAALADDHVGLFAFAEQPLRFQRPGKGRAQVFRLLEGLYPLQAAPRESNYRLAFTHLATQLRKRALIILFTDLIDPEASRRLIDSVGVLSRHHRVLCVAFSDYELADMVKAAPEGTNDLYRQAVAAGMLDDRRRALAELARRGVLSVDAGPSGLTVAAVNKYLELKAAAKV